MKFIYGVIAAVALFALARGCADCSSHSNGSQNTSQPATSQPATSQPATSQPADLGANWYEGGTLHRRTMEEWKNGNPGDKLATAGDWVAHVREKLKSDIKPGSVDALKPLAAKLATCVEASYEDSTAGQKASDMAALCMAFMGWLE